MWSRGGSLGRVVLLHLFERAFLGLCPRGIRPFLLVDLHPHSSQILFR
jgi:hypothetical protein